MDQATRNKLRSVVTQCRRLLEDAVSQVLQGKFGVYAAKKDEVQVDDEARMSHLTDEERTARKDILDHFAHIKARGFKPKEALDQLVREIAYTHLNRLCAYKMMEARQVYVGDQKFREAVSRGVNSNGVKFYLADHLDDERLYTTGNQELAYRHFLDWLGGLLSEEIGVLFSPHDPANRLYPPQRVLDEVLALVNDEALGEIWGQDETIGWIYQYFTPKELRDQARKESAAPRNSYELAFRNQFFTPRYVVEFLTDNTLGRIWYEMRKGDTKLKDQYRYLVRRPSEVFLAEGQSPPEPTQNQDGLSQEELLKQPVHIPFRPKKDPRELRILDPACGSGHFLLYCFDLLLTIYEEAYADPDLGPKLKEDYPTLEALRRDAPRLILAHNLHDIDIDLRATQITALALWLRCQRAYREMGLKQDRPKITKSDIVCAEPMPGEKALLDDFLKTLKQDRLENLIKRVMQVPEGSRVRATESMVESLTELVRLVWDKMRLAGEAGSLLKIEEELQEAVRKGQEEWEEKQPLFRFTEFSLTEEPKETYVRYVPGEGVSFWQRAEALVLEALRDYASHAANGGRLQRQLFADDATHGFAFIDLCQKRFDVVLMNPPFGDMPERLLNYLAIHYISSKYDLGTACIHRGFHFLRCGGRLGWISPRTWFSLSLLESFRKEVLYQGNSLDLVLDLGIGVLDTALVETACCVAQRSGRSSPIISVARLLASRNKERDVALLFSTDKSAWRAVSTDLVQSLPRSAFGYWFPAEFATHLKAIARFDSAGGEARQGLATTDDFRFLRCLWEVPHNQIGFGKRWVPFAKGGEYEPYYDDLHLVIDYAEDGRVLKEYLMKEKGQKHWSRRIACSEYYGRIGLTYPERTTSDFSLRPLAAGSIFSATGQAVFAPSRETLLRYLALSYTRLFKQLMELFVGSGDASESGSAARHYTSGILNEMPIPPLDDGKGASVDALATEAIRFRRSETSSVENTHDFILPVLISPGQPTPLAEAIDRAKCRYFYDVMRLLAIGEKLDRWACELYGLNAQQATAFLSEEVCRYPTEYSEATVGEARLAKLNQTSLTQLVEEVCETHGYRRSFTKKAYWANRRLELAAHLLEVAPASLKGLDIADVSRHLERPVQDVVSWLVGVSFGVWDVRLALGSRSLPSHCGPFDPVPVCPPGMLQGSDGLPARDSPKDYPLRSDCDGIIPDDPDHSDDIVRRVREVLELVWKDRAETIEKEACELLGVKELRDYFRKPGKGGFWDDHVARYSKSRRKAPIYWLLQSSKKSYALWLCYHRLDKDILFKALLKYVEPKVRLEQSRLDTLRSQKSALGDAAKGAKKIDKDIERQEALLGEVNDFEEKLRRAANLSFGKNLDSSVIYDPDLSDGVVLNIAPLWELVPWKEAKGYWDELLAGGYEWSSMGKLLRKKVLVK
jgi:hypothetical protein